MDIRFVSSFSVVTSDPAADQALFVGALGLPLHPPEGAAGEDYVFSEEVPGCKHFGVWPLSEAAQACFGTPTWPDTHPVPQASVEFDVDDVEAAARELEARGYRLLHGARTEPWGQAIARLQSADGLVVGVSYTPWMREGGA
jgi:catechol 2,3-dioxygenase-like lactoylglutathione lyase family enzyme